MRYRASSTGSRGHDRGGAKGLLPAARRRKRSTALVMAFAMVASLIASGSALVVAPAHARYAEGGAGLHTGAIDWFEWGTHNQAIPAEGLTRTNTRTVAGQDLATTCTLSNVAGEVVAYRPGAWSGDSLDELYNIGGTGTQNQLIAGLSNFVDASTVSFHIDCSVTLDGTPVPLEGLVVADAEASSATQNEYVQATPDQPVTWRVIDRYRGEDCTTSTQAILSADGTMRLAPNGPECFGPMAVAFMEGATSAQIELNGGGKSAVAVGVVLQTDFGDAPASYGEAGAMIAPEWEGGTVPVGTTAVSGDDFVLGTTTQPRLRLGATADAEGAHQPSADALGDDAQGADEDAVGPLGTVFVAAGSTYTLNDVVCAGTGFVSGWIDWNHNGTFDEGEQSDVVACADGSVDLSWTVPADVTSTPVGSQTFLRLRIGADAGAVASPTGLSTSGEVEDHALTVAFAPQSFECTSNAAGLLFQSLDTATTHIQSIDLVTGDYTAAVVSGPEGNYSINAVGFNALDGFVYGYDYNTGELVRVGADGAVETLGRPDYIPTGQVFDTGDVDENGHLWITQVGPDRPWFQIDLVPGSPTYLGVINQGVGTIPQGLAGGPDWAHVPGGGDHLYRVMTRPGGSEAVLVSFNRSTGEYAVVGDLGDLGASNNFGAVYADSDGYLYASSNGTGAIFRFDVHTAEATLWANGPASSGNDGARCTASAILTDFGDAPASYGTTLSDDGARHGIPGFDSSTNTAPVMLGALIDPEGDGQPNAAADGDDTFGLADEDGVAAPIVVTVGDETTVAVSTTNDTDQPATLAGWIDLDHNGTFDEGERVLLTVPANSGTTTQSLVFPAGTVSGDTYARFRLFGGEVTDPAPTGVGAGGEVEDYSVAVIARALLVEKISNATANTRVGNTVSYTVTATNTGTADYTAVNPAVVLDDLSGVLDDATYNTDAEASRAGELSFESPLLGWTGALPAGESVEITYTVTLIAGGDGEVRNVAFEPNDPEDPVTPECNPPEGGIDPETGESCFEVEFLLPRLTIDKVADRTELPAVGEVVEYTVTVTNVGPGVYTEAAPASFSDDLSDVLDDSTIVEGSLEASTGGAAIVDGELTWSGALAADASVTVTYSMTYTGAGDQMLLNTACIPATEAAPGAAVCDTAEVPGSLLTQWKTVSSSSDPAVAGSVLTYTLFFENSGQAAATVDAIDDLTHVLDVAAVTLEPTSADGLTVVRDGEQISVTGSVPVGETYSVNYQATLLADGERGDDIAANFLLDNDPEDPPVPPTDPVCVPADGERPDCTVTQIAAVTYAKSVTASTDPVDEGTVLTYTVTVTSTGTATSPVAREDVLTDVLDDATLVSAPVSDTASVTVSDIADGRFLIGGELASGEVATITYSVSVNDEAERGNNAANNFLVPPGEEPPAQCVPGMECTSTPLPNVTSAKSADPASGETVVAGQEVTYTLTFTNSGQAAGAVEHTDLLGGVFDDAELTVDPAASDEALTVTTGADDSLSVTGVLAAGQTVTVSYTVTVLPDGQRGDNILGNFLVETGEEPPVNCEPGDPNCTEHRIPELEWWKTVSADVTPVAEGTVLTYTLTFQNIGEATGVLDMFDDLTHVTDDADVSLEPSSEDLTVSRDGDRISIIGDVPAGELYSVTYEVTIRADEERGDDLAANFLLVNDPVNPPVPPADPVCQPTDNERPDCTVTPIGRLLTGKAVSSDGDPVVAGSTLTYTLTFDNQGHAPVIVDHTDILTDVLDDADLVGAPEVSDEALALALGDDSLVVSGELAAGQTVTVTYQVVVNEEADRGNNTADNFLVPTGTTPPETCEPGDANCTTTPLPNVASAKSADPASGSTVVAGQQVTYTLTFTNSGQAAGPVDHTDLLAGVLDDAELTVAPAASDEALNVTSGDDEIIRVIGSLEAGQTVTVSYTATVLPDGERGDNVLGNFLLKSGEVPPTTCEVGDPNCTEHRIPEIESSKSVNPASGTPVVAGQELTYTLTFTNTGAAAGNVAKVDDLTHVTDDATVVSEPVASTGAVTATRDGNRITIDGELGVGETVTVSYTVEVNPSGERGDDILGNFLLDPEQEPPAEPVCVPVEGELPNCTRNPVGDIVPGKSVDPATGSEVGEGQVLTYTLSFANVGQGETGVDYMDHMADVLDDADWVGNVTVSDGLAVAGPEADSLHITGTVAAGETSTVTYQVRVKDYEDQGNNILANFLTPSSETLSGECLPSNPLCTQNPTDPPAAPVEPPVKPGLPGSGAETPVGLGVASALLLVLGGAIVIATRRGMAHAGPAPRRRA